jgi:hypothetical protein
LLHEHLFPGTNKHWSSLEAMYREKSESLSDAYEATFTQRLAQFLKACSFQDKNGLHLMPQLRSAFLILTFYRVWRELDDVYAKGNFDFAAFISDFETARTENPKDVPYVVFTSALSNAGYAENRIRERHEILMSRLLQRAPGMPVKDKTRRTFTEAQKLAIWERAAHQCEFEKDGVRCAELFSEFRAADADHIQRWVDGGPTALENGRLLCHLHNRGPKDSPAATAVP